MMHGHQARSAESPDETAITVPLLLPLAWYLEHVNIHRLYRRFDHRALGLTQERQIVLESIQHTLPDRAWVQCARLTCTTTGR